MKLKEYIRANPGFLKRAMRCDNTEEIYRLVRLEGIEASPKDIDYAVSLLNLGDHELEAVAGAGGKVVSSCVGGVKPRANLDGANYAPRPQPSVVSGGQQLRQSLNKPSYASNPQLGTVPVCPIPPPLFQSI